MLDPEELSFTFQRPTRFVDLEGGPSIFAEPSEIADRYHKALATYLDEMKKVVLETGVDYRRISIDAPFETSLTEFLVDRARGKGQAMSFLQPWLLLGLPLLFLPIIIHLINQWRYQTKRWGAMMFLLAANRMARGYAKIRQYLILAMRMLAILGLIFAISRPLASGLLGLSGGKTDTTIVLLDRSPSMQERGENGIDSKFTTAKRQLRAKRCRPWDRTVGY